MWSIANELSSRPGPGQTAYIKGAVALAHQLDPTRPVGLALAGYPSVSCQSAYAPLQVIGINDYFGWYPGPGGQISDRTLLPAYLDAQEHCYHRQALMVTEFGAEADRDGPVQERGTYEFQNDFIQYHLGVFATKPYLSAALYWALAGLPRLPGLDRREPDPGSADLPQGPTRLQRQPQAGLRDRQAAVRGDPAGGVDAGAPAPARRRAVAKVTRPMASTTTKLEVSSRTPDGSRSARRLRRSGRVPGVIYGGGGEAVSFDVDERELRHALAASGAVIDVSVDGGGSTPVVLKDAQRHPVRGQTVHIDLLRVRLDKPIEAVVPLELLGADDAPGVKVGGIVEHIVREVTIEALPNNIPETLSYDVSELEIGDTVTLSAVVAPEGVTIIDDPEETIVILSAPRLQTEEDEIESETERVGEEPAARPKAPASPRVAAPAAPSAGASRVVERS